MKHLCAGVALLLTVLSVACMDASSETFLERETTSSPLMGTFASYSTVDEIQSKHFQGTTWSVIEDSRLASNDSRPRFDILKVSVPGYVHLGQSGELELEFFNDRLSSAWFYPDDAQSYHAALAKAGLPVVERDSSATEEEVAPYTLVWATRDYRGRSYVGWADSRLRAQQTRWIDRYS
jgi:hypothetical protein